ncbi:MAG TPA: transposase [Candidatus Dormibacteraeota bacterium]|nr:transposase [Candidatus Dormibacteraeota bacterium]
MIVSHRIRLVPTAAQEGTFRRACGTARFAYNWALAEWQREYRAGGTPTEASLRKSLNARKASEFPWMYEVPKTVVQHAIKHLGVAYKNFFDDCARFKRGQLKAQRIRRPRFKKKGRHEAFRVDNGTDKTRPNAVCVDGKCVKLSRIGWVRMREEVRFAGSILSATISRQADAWYCVFIVDVGDIPAEGTARGIVGIDLGIAHLATLSDGSTPIESPKPLRRLLGKLKRLNRALHRKVKGSCNRAKAKTTLARLHARIAHIRADALHKLTTDLVQRFGIIVIEDLNVRGMLANRKLSLAIADIGFFEFRRQLEYKVKMSGASLIVADRWYPSSKLCSMCEVKNEHLTLGERSWVCLSCGTAHDRDVNAARNLARYPESWAGSACGAEGAREAAIRLVKPAA